MDWSGRAEAGVCPQPEPGSVQGSGVSLHSRDRSGLSLDTWGFRAGSALGQRWPLLPMSVLAAGGPCPRGGDQGFAGSLENGLMYFANDDGNPFSVCFVLFLKFLMDAGTATLLHFVPGDDSVGRDTAAAVPARGWTRRALGDSRVPQGRGESRAR